MKIPPNPIIASGPVIIENGKVLLNKEKKNGNKTSWFFPGGKVKDLNEDLETACRREVKEELGIDIEIIKPLETLTYETDEKVVVLAHYLAKRIGEIKPGKEIADWGWHDINKLPADCADNVKEIISDIIKGA